MNLTLTRNLFFEDGIFGELKDEHGCLIAMTLEHSYESSPKLPAGEYICMRGAHRLKGSKEPFITFEVVGVAGHTGILFHVGNYNNESDGCILVGTQVVDRMTSGKMIVDSKKAFQKFIDLQAGIDTFKLTVYNVT